MPPLISVILPVYNQEKYVAETIESVLAQTFADFELLLHDDGSTDGSAAIIRDYAARDSRIRASFAPNAGRCEATNNLIAEAQGEWCALLDADDIMLPERLEKQLAYHQAHPEVDATSCNCQYINEHGRHLGIQRYPNLHTIENGRRELAEGQTVQCAFTGIMVNCEVYKKVGGLRSKFWPCDDLEFTNRVLEQGFALVIIQEVLMRYRVHTQSITRSKPWDMVNRIDYVNRCVALRRSGNSEISFAEFMVERESSSWWVRINRRRNSYSFMLQHEAGFSLHAKNYLGFGWRLTTVLLINPALGVATIRKGFANRASFNTSS